MLIIFDLDDTLIDTTGSIVSPQLARLLATMEERGLFVGDRKKALDVLYRLNASCEDSDAVILEFLEMVDGDNSYFQLARSEIDQMVFSDIKIETVRGARELLNELSEHHKLALVSRGNRERQLLKLKKAGIDASLFSKLMISEESDKEPSYSSLLELFCTSPFDTLVCGDRVQLDLVPAKKLGCVTVHLRSGRGAASPFIAYPGDVDFSIDKLVDIRAIIREISTVIPC